MSFRSPLYPVFPTHSKNRKKILIDAHVKTFVRIFGNSHKLLKYLNLLQGVLN